MQIMTLYNMVVMNKLSNGKVERPRESHEGLRILARIIAKYYTLQSTSHTTATSEIHVARETRRKNIPANAHYQPEDRPGD